MRTFFISSSGSMATKWLSEVLSASSSLRCFHGAIGLLPSIDNPALNDVFSALQRYAVAHQVVSGVVHLGSHHGISALPMAQQHGSVFLALVRNPIEVISSQYTEKNKNPEMVARAREWHMKTPFADITASSPLFLRCASNALKHYFECGALPDEAVFRFEYYTKKYEELERLLSFVGAPADEHIRQAFDRRGIVNAHHAAPVTYEEIFHRRWTESEREAFRQVRDRMAAPLPDFQRNPSYYPYIMSL